MFIVYLYITMCVNPKITIQILRHVRTQNLLKLLSLLKMVWKESVALKGETSEII
jgi:hypothetical protein